MFAHFPHQNIVRHISAVQREGELRDEDRRLAGLQEICDTRRRRDSLQPRRHVSTHRPLIVNLTNNEPGENRIKVPILQMLNYWH